MRRRALGVTSRSGSASLVGSTRASGTSDKPAATQAAPLSSTLPDGVPSGCAAGSAAKAARPTRS